MLARYFCNVLLGHEAPCQSYICKEHWKTINYVQHKLIIILTISILGTVIYRQSFVKIERAQALDGTRTTLGSLLGKNIGNI